MTMATTVAVRFPRLHVNRERGALVDDHDYHRGRPVFRPHVSLEPPM